MRKGRKTIISELNIAKKELAYYRESAMNKNAIINGLSMQIDKERADFRRRLERLETETEYAKDADRGTVISTARIDPETLTFEGRARRVVMPEDVRREMCVRIGDELFARGLVKVTTEPDRITGMARVIARVDVIPWDKISSRKPQVVVNFDRRNAFDPDGKVTLTIKGAAE